MLLASPGRRHTVSVLAFDGMAPFELGAVVEVFGLPRPELEIPWYDLRVCSVEREPMRAVGGFMMTTQNGLDIFAGADTVMVVAVPDVGGEMPPELVAALREAHDRGARVVSICSGAFALAAAGLLDGREVATHWQYAELLQRRHPEIRVNPDVLYVDGDDILTGAGSAAGLDLCLHLVRKDHGARIANSVARRLVVPPHRDGGQAQFVEAVVSEPAADDCVARAMAWALEHLAEPITVADMARQAHLAPRRDRRGRWLRQPGDLPAPLHPCHEDPALGLPTHLPHHRLSGSQKCRRWAARCRFVMIDNRAALSHPVWTGISREHLGP